MPNRNDPDYLRRQTARYVIAPGLLADLRAQVRKRAKTDDKAESDKGTEPSARVILELNVDYAGGLPASREAAIKVLADLPIDGERIEKAARRSSRHNLFVRLTLSELERLATELDRLTRRETPDYPIYKVWRDEALKPFVARSIRTIKADACLATFGSDGKDIAVAVVDSGIDKGHAQFAKHANLTPPSGVRHRDFTEDAPDNDSGALVDAFGHGTHVAGIVAGHLCGEPDKVIIRLGEVLDDQTSGGGRPSVRTVATTIEEPSVFHGVAPRARLVSLKVLDDDGRGYASALIEALEYVQEVNDSGRKYNIHCVNLSLGYPFEAEWYAAGQSPLCAMVNRLVRSGVVVVAAAGNDGSMVLSKKRMGMDQTINDPGNAEGAITVGSTHGEAPHQYGVSFFSSRGPTADGRVKPDLLAPGERILSCAARSKKLTDALTDAGEPERADAVYYREESGTSMAAPHVAGAVAAFLSYQKEFIGQPEAVKRIFMDSCTDLKRKRDFQGAGLIDLMRAVQSV